MFVTEVASYCHTTFGRINRLGSAVGMMRQLKENSLTQSYGPEARGGASKAEVILSAGEIAYPEVISADVLVALSQEACDKYASN